MPASAAWFSSIRPASLAPRSPTTHCCLAPHACGSTELLNRVRTYRLAVPVSAAIRWAVAASGKVASIFSAWFNCTVPRGRSPDLK